MIVLLLETQLGVLVARLSGALIAPSTFQSHDHRYADVINRIEHAQKQMGAEPMNSPLIDYALAGLQRCWVPENGTWSHIYHLDTQETPNESILHSNVFYTLNVLLGLARVPTVPSSIDVESIFQQNASRLIALPVNKYAFGAALWAAAELKLNVPADVLAFIESMLADKRQWENFTAQDLGMILIGVVAQAKHDPQKWSALADELFHYLATRYHSKSGLFFDAAHGLRRRFSSFATQTYLTLASYIYGEFTNNAQALEIADACTSKLISLQGPNGEWPWFFDSNLGHVLDFYEVYTVHQYGMAPAFLEHAERRGVQGARHALIHGFNWVFGQNQLGVPMLVPELQLSIRSQVRKGELHTKNLRILRAILGSVLGRQTGLIDRANIDLRRECRSYELGWVLWSFGQRTDLPELTHHTAFAEAVTRYQTRPVTALT